MMAAPGETILGKGEAALVSRFADVQAAREVQAAPRRAALSAEVQKAAARPLRTAGTLADESDDASWLVEVCDDILERGAAEPVIADAEASPLRAIEPLLLPDVQTRPAPTGAPLVEWMPPTDLLVDATYQRDLSDASRRLIRRVVEGWDWRRFKPPIVAWTERGFEVIDGQHTAIAAATRGVERIPVLVVEAAQLQDRASAFIGHNKDRLVVSAAQMHRAAMAAGDEDALTIQQVCDRAGATIIRNRYGGRTYKPGETDAVGAIAGLITRRNAKGAREVLEVLVQSQVAPISSAGMKAVEYLLFDPAYAGRFEPADLAKAIEQVGDAAESEAKTYADANRVPRWVGMAVTWFRRTKKRSAA